MHDLARGRSSADAKVTPMKPNHKPQKQQGTLSHVEQLRALKPLRESDGAPTPRKKLNGISRSATTYANKRSKPVS